MNEEEMPKREASSSSESLIQGINDSRGPKFQIACFNSAKGGSEHMPEFGHTVGGFIASLRTWSCGFIPFLLFVYGSVGIAGEVDTFRLSFRDPKNYSGQNSLQIDFSETQFIRSDKEYFKYGPGNGSLTSVGLGTNYQWRRSQHGVKVQGRLFYSNQEGALYNFIPDLHYSLSSRRGNQRMVVGRKTHDWSRSEKWWRGGMWQPRFSWDKLNYSPEGLTGLFYQLRGKNVEITGFYSGVFIPESSPHFSVEDGEVRSQNPWFPMLPPRIGIFGVANRINYSLKQMDMSEIVEHQSLALQFKMKKNGYFIEGAIADKPINTLFMRLPNHQTTQKTVNVELRPTVLRHRLSGVDIGYENQSWEIWQNFTEEVPVMDSPNSKWISQWAEPNTQVTSFIGYTFENQAKAFLSLHQQFGGDVSDWGENAQQGESLFESRFQYYEAVKVGVKNLKFFRKWPLKLGFEGLYDEAQKSSVFQSSGMWQFQKQTSLNVQMSLLGLVNGSEVSKPNGFVRRYRANDNVSVGVSHVF